MPRSCSFCRPSKPGLLEETVEENIQAATKPEDPHVKPHHLQGFGTDSAVLPATATQAPNVLIPDRYGSDWLGACRLSK